MGINSFLTKFFGNKSDRDLKEVQPFVDKILKVYPEISLLSNDELRAKTESLKEELKDCVKAENEEIKSLRTTVDDGSVAFNEREGIYDQIDALEKTIVEKLELKLDEMVPVAFSIVRDTARRLTEGDSIEVTASQMDRDLAAEHDFVTIEGDQASYSSAWLAGGHEIEWNMVHYDCQLFGGVVLHKGKIAEMATGEGKTLAATLPVFLNALTGRGVHVVTVNDYLAKRDSEWMGPIYQFHGLTVDCIDNHQPNSEARRQAYRSDITFGTNNEFGFDYLRDNMAFSPKDLVQRKPNYAIVDEVDSVLIDDARTPLIISGPVPRGEDQQFEEHRPKVERIVTMQRQMATKFLSEAKQKITSTDKKVAEEGALLLFRAHKAYPKYKPLIKFLSEEGIKAQMLKTENFYMQENNKNMHVATDELFFVIDEKTNSIELTDKGIDAITGSSDDPELFVLPNIGDEIADIEKNEDLTDEQRLELKDAALQNFSVKSERVHTIQQLLRAYSMFEKDDQYVVMDNKVKIVDEQTGRIMEGRRYSDGLHQAIESKEHVKVEAATQTMASITLQNYFRMYEKLSGMTGTAETEAGELWDIYALDVVVIPTNRPISRNDMDDMVYKTVREKYNAVSEGIAAEVAKGRPVLVGTTSVEISELLSRMLKRKGIKHNVLNAKLHQREADIVAEAGKAGNVTIATNMAGRGTDIKLSKEVKDAGGLAIIGTERHESRRVDRQLRGRAGRQGDPGSSVFYVSLEDNLMRLFSSDRIVGVMDRLGHEEGDVIQHPMISKSIERAQRKVEENNFGVRKRLLEYDDVMNSQREVIYTKRKHALLGERMAVEVSNMLYDACDSVVRSNHEAGDYDNLKLDTFRLLSIDTPFTEEDFKEKNVDKLVEVTYDTAVEAYKRKSEQMGKIAYPVVKDVFEKRGQDYEKILIPITDGKLTYNVPTDLKAAYNSLGVEVARAFEKAVLLHVIDELWKEHLRELDDLKQSVQNASYEQKDPLLIYKFESFNLFKLMIDEVSKRSVSALIKAQIPTRDPNEVKQAKEKRLDNSRYRARHDGMSADGKSKEQKKVQPVRIEAKVGRNEPCPCGSGKKYKSCHGKA